MRTDDDSRWANEFARSFLRKYALQVLPPKQMELWLSAGVLSLKTAIPAPCPRLFVQIWPRQWVDCAAARTTFLDPFLIHEPFLHDLYFEPRYEEFKPRTIWSLSNAFTSAFKELDPIPQFKATAKLSEFLKGRFS